MIGNGITIDTYYYPPTTVGGNTYPQPSTNPVYPVPYSPIVLIDGMEMGQWVLSHKLDRIIELLEELNGKFPSIFE